MLSKILREIKIQSFFSGISRKFLIYFFILSVIPILSISFLGFKISESLVIKQNRKSLDLQNELVNNRISNLFSQARFNISQANRTNVPLYNWIQERLSSPVYEGRDDFTDISFFLEEKISKDGYFSSLALLGKNNKIYSMTDSAAVKLGKAVSGLIPDRQKDLLIILDPPKGIPSPAILLVEAIKDLKNQNLAFIIGLLNNNQITAILNNFLDKKQTSRLYVLDQNNTILFRSSKTADNSNTIETQINITENLSFVKRSDGQRVLRIHKSMDYQNWKMVSEITFIRAMEDIIKFRNQIILGMLLLSFLLISVAIVYSRRISVPIRKLVYAAQDIGDGLLEAPIRIQTSDEIGILAREFDEMREKLLDSYENLENKVQERTRELKQAQYQIMQQEKMASLGLIAAGIAHEIGNPLTSISSLIQILKRRLVDEKNRDYLMQTMKNIDRISKIVRELVDFSRPSNYEAALTNINEVTQAAVGIVKYDRRSKNIVFKLNLDPQIPSTVLVADQLLQVIINILINAVDAMEGFGKDIFLSTFFKKNAITIEIRDTGSGIPNDKLGKIFEPFYTTKDVGRGTGLGLSVSYGIIKNFNGDIKVTSEEKKGSIFSIILPIQKQSEDSL